MVSGRSVDLGLGPHYSHKKTATTLKVGHFSPFLAGTVGSYGRRGLERCQRSLFVSDDSERLTSMMNTSHGLYRAERRRIWFADPLLLQVRFNSCEDI